MSMIYMFIDLNHNHDCVKLKYVKYFLLFDNLLSIMNFNKSRPTFQDVPGNTGLSFWEEQW